MSPEAAAQAPHHRWLCLPFWGTLQVQYVAQRLSSLLLVDDTRTDLLRLPCGLMQQLLASEALDVEQVGLPSWTILLQFSTGSSSNCNCKRNSQSQIVRTSSSGVPATTACEFGLGG
jgi:hypothetical protein